MEPDAVKEHLLIAFRYAHDEEDWVTPLSEALDGVTLEEALWRPVPVAKCIWEIVLHMAVWTDNIVERIRRGEYCRPAEGAWPPLPPQQDAEAWENARLRLQTALSDLRAFIEASPLDVLNGPPYGLGDLLCRLIHNAYHIGQITKLRDCWAARGGV
jgi:hypothetical protein